MNLRRAARFHLYIFRRLPPMHKNQHVGKNTDKGAYTCSIVVEYVLKSPIFGLKENRYGFYNINS